MAKIEKGEVRNPYGRKGKPKPVNQDAQVNQDGWQNLFTLAGTGHDRSTQTHYRAEKSLPRTELEGIFSSGGIGRRIVELPAQEMTRQWFTLDGGAEPVMDDMESAQVQAAITEGVTLGRLYGGAIGVIIMDDGLELDQPVNESAIRKVLGIRLYDRWQVQCNDNDLCADSASMRYGQPEWWRIWPYRAGGSFRVHHSRAIHFPGLTVPERVRQRNQGWDFSVLDAVYADLQRLFDGMGASVSIIQDFVQGVLSVEGLQDMIASGNEALVKKRLDLLDMSRHVLNTMLLDANEKYTKEASSVAGLGDLLDRFKMMLSASSGIPVTKLFGQSPGGLNATGESDTRNYYDDLASQQKKTLNPIMEKVVRLFLLARDGTLRGREPESWSIKWNSLWQPTDKEEAELRKLVAETDKAYLEMGVVSPSEIAVSRFGNGYSTETTIVSGGPE